MRTFHIGGAVSGGGAVSNVQVKSKGTVRLHNMKTVHHKDDRLITVSRSGEIVIADEAKRERERYKVLTVPY